MSYFYSQPSRAPNWKWQRALGIIEGTQPEAADMLDSRAGKEWICRAVAFYKAYEKEPDPLKNFDLITQFSDIYTAYEFYQDTSTYMRSEIEASILARATAAEIALSSAATTAAIVAYEALFFDVRDRLDCDSYINNYVIGKDMQKLTKDKLDTIWKLFAYKLGYQVLKAVVSRTVNPQYSLTPDTVGAGLRDDIMGSFSVACAIAAKHPDGGDEEQKHLLSLFARFTEISKIEDKSTSGQGQMLEHLEAMLRQIPFSNSGMELADDTRGRSLQYMKCSADPTMEELTEFALTGMSSSFEEASKLSYPEPPKKKKEKPTNG